LIIISYADYRWIALVNAYYDEVRKSNQAYVVMEKVNMKRSDFSRQTICSIASSVNTPQENGRESDAECRKQVSIV
jgi:hypothetical protein